MKSRTLISVLAITALLLGSLLTSTPGLAQTTTGSVAGTTTYSGAHDPNHNVLVSAHPDPNSDPVASAHIWMPGSYLLEDLPNGNYYISAFLDIHDRDEGPPEFGEPLGWYDANSDGNPDPVTVNGGQVSGVDIIIEDIDSEYIQGTACYLGGMEGLGSLEVALHLNPNLPPVSAQYISPPCSEYVFSLLPVGTYYVSLFYDVNNSSGAPEPGEPVGWYDANGDGNPDPINYSGNIITDIDITLGGRHYVDRFAEGTADGSSWENAFQDLQSALTAATPGEEIWVAAGIYTPGTSREASFVLQDGVAVYGGFSGTEVTRSQRNWRANVTVLSGEIGDPTAKTDNTFHVVTTASTYENPLGPDTILDGFTITGGYANVEPGHTDKGGGLLNNFGNPTLVNLNFIYNYALNHGGALATQYNEQPLVITNCTFSGNHATNNAGAIANLSKVIVINSSIAGNTGGNGGGIVALSDTETEVHNTILWDNQGEDIALQGLTTSHVSYSIIEGGFASGTNILTSDPLLVDANGPDNIYGTLDDDLHLQAGSPAIDAGNNSLSPTDIADSDGDGNISESLPLDIDSNSRFYDDPASPDSGIGTAPLLDMGADEFHPPVAIADLQIASSAPTLSGETTAFAARVSSGSQVSYTWTFGDSNSVTGPLPTHVYSEPGVYSVVLTATNSLGSTHASVIVEVFDSLSIAPGESQTTEDGLVTITVPLSAGSTVTVNYTPLQSPSNDSGGFAFAGIVFNLQAFDGDDQPIVEPDVPFTITVYYNEDDLPTGSDESSLQIHRYDEASAAWLPMTIQSRDIANNSITIVLDHFSQFALYAEQTEYNIFLPLIMR